MIIIIKSSDEKKIELTVEELKKYLEEARQEGYDEGYRIGSANALRYPAYCNDYQKKNWWEYGITCSDRTKESISSENII